MGLESQWKSRTERELRDKAFPKYIAFSFSLTFAAPQKCISYLLLFPALANVLENTALFGDILLRLPDITYKVRSYHQHSVEGRKRFIRDTWLSSTELSLHMNFTERQG